MKKFLVLSLLLLSVGGQAQQEDDLDFSDLDKVEEEEFGSQETPADDSADFDLENPEAPKEEAADAAKDLDSELDQAGEEGLGSDPVDLEKELDDSAEQSVAPNQPAEEPAVPAPVEEGLPTLEAPAPENQVSEPVQPSPIVEVPPAPISTDEPNAQLEARMNRIYQKFMGQRTTDEEWLQIAGEKAKESYQVQAGDTLWAISVTFFGNGFFWPKLWQLNESITNPHVIQPGKVLVFSPGSLGDSPQIEVNEQGQEASAPTEESTDLPAEEGATAVAEAEPVVEEQGPEIPPAKPTVPSLQKIPPSLPPLVFEDEGGFDQDGFSIEKQKADISDPAVSLTHFVAEEDIDGEGAVVGFEATGAKTAGTWQYLYAKVPSGKIGDVLTVLAPSARKLSSKVGKAFDYQGQIKLVSRAADDEPVFRALVTKALAPVKLDAILSTESIPQVVLDKEGRENGAQGAIIGAQYDQERKVLGLNSVVYLDVGKDQGLSDGDVMSIVRNELIRNPDYKIKKPQIPIGKLKIAKATANRATAVIVESSDVVMPGDVVGGFTVAKVEDQVETPQPLSDEGLEKEAPEGEDVEVLDYDLGEE